jgi:hypothetical protein
VKQEEKTNICEECEKEFKTPQALGAHRVLYHRVNEADLEEIKHGTDLKDKKITELKASASQKAQRIQTLEAEREASVCPSCGNLVGWSRLPLEECPLESYDRGNPKEWHMEIGPVEKIKYRQCPNCNYFEKA